MNDVEILQEAQRNLSLFKANYICHAIRLIGERNSEYVARCNILEEWITFMIFPYGTVERWINAKGIVVSKQKDLDIMRDYRIKWLNRLIKLCEEE